MEFLTENGIVRVLRNERNLMRLLPSNHKKRLIRGDDHQTMGNN